MPYTPEYARLVPVVDVLRGIAGLCQETMRQEHQRDEFRRNVGELAERIRAVQSPIPLDWPQLVSVSDDPHQRYLATIDWVRSIELFCIAQIHRMDRDDGISPQGVDFPELVP